MLLIGEVAERSGMATSAIRYYEGLGLVRSATRKSGRRLFAESVANRLQTITAAREAGFSLEEIRRLLDSQAEGTTEWRDLVEAKIAEVTSRIDRLEAVASTLRESLSCGCEAWDDCTLVAAGANGSRSGRSTPL